MNLSAIILMIVVLGLLWGGFLFFIQLAARKEKEKHPE